MVVPRVMFSSIIKIGSTVKPGDVSTIKPDPEGVEIRRLRRLHRFRMLGGKTGHQSLARKIGEDQKSTDYADYTDLVD